MKPIRCSGMFMGRHVAEGSDQLSTMSRDLGVPGNHLLVLSYMDTYTYIIHQRIFICYNLRVPYLVHGSYTNSVSLIIYRYLTTKSYLVHEYIYISFMKDCYNLRVPYTVVTQILSTWTHKFGQTGLWNLDK